MEPRQILAALDANIKVHQKTLDDLIQARNKLALSLAEERYAMKYDRERHKAFVDRTVARVIHILGAGAKTQGGIEARLSGPQRNVLEEALEALKPRLTVINGAYHLDYVKDPIMGLPPEPQPAPATTDDFFDLRLND